MKLVFTESALDLISPFFKYHLRTIFRFASQENKQPKIQYREIIINGILLAFLYRKDIELLQKPTFERSPGDP